MATPVQGSAAAPDSERLHPVLDVFFSPVATMDSLARKPRMLVAIVLMTLLGATAMTIAYQKGVIEHGIRQQMESNPRFEQVPADRRDQIIEQSVRIGSMVALGAGVAGPTIGLLLTSGVLLLLTKLIGGLGVTYRQMMGVVAHGWLPLSLSQLVAIPILLAKDPEAIDFQNIVPMANLSFLFSPSEQHRLYMIASSIDLFSFWVMALFTIGIARLTGKSKAAALVVVLVPWVVYVLLFKALRG